MADIFTWIYALLLLGLLFLILRGLYKFVRHILYCWTTRRRTRAVMLILAAAGIVVAAFFLLKILIIAGIALVVFSVCSNKGPIVYYYD